jgi:hypothetical protein
MCINSKRIFLISNLVFFNSCSILLWSPHGNEYEERGAGSSYVFNSFQNTYLSILLPKTEYNDKYDFDDNFYEIEIVKNNAFPPKYLNPSVEYLQTNYPPLINIPQSYRNWKYYNIRRLYRGGCEYFFPIDSGKNRFRIELFLPHKERWIETVAPHPFDAPHVVVPENHTITFYLNESRKKLLWKIVPTKTNFGECKLDETYMDHKFFK